MQTGYFDSFSHTEEFNPHQYMYLVKCPFCSQNHAVSIPANELYAYRQGAHIQNAMPSLSDDEREILITGICPECWAEMFPDEDDDDMPFIVFVE